MGVEVGLGKGRDRLTMGVGREGGWGMGWEDVWESGGREREVCVSRTLSFSDNFLVILAYCVCT